MPNTNFNIKSEFVSIHIRTKTQHAEKSASLSFKFDLLSLPRLQQGNLQEYCYTLTSFVHQHAPCAWFCSEKRQSLLFSTHLFGKGASQIKVPSILRAFWDWEGALRLEGKRHCHPPRSTPRFTCRFTASNDSHCYSTCFLRLGERAPSISDCKFARKKKT